MNKPALIGFVFLLLSQSVFSQQFMDPVYEYPYQLYTVQDGLSQGQVFDAFMDSRGFVWVCTKEGVDRFDGLAFDNFRTDSTFIEDSVSHIKEDKKGNVWFSGRTGAYRYNGKRIDFFQWDFQYRPPNIFFEKDRVMFNFIPTQGGSPLYYSDYYTLEEERIVSSKYSIGLSPDQKGYDKVNLLSIEGLCFGMSIPTGSKDPSDQYLYLIENKKAIFLAQDSIIRHISHFPPADTMIYFLLGQKIYRYSGDSLLYIRDCPIQGKKYIFLIEDKLGFRENKEIYVEDEQGNFQSVFKSPFHINTITNGLDGVFLNTERGMVRLFTDHAFQNFPIDKGMLSEVWSILEDDHKNMLFASFFERKIIKFDRQGYQNIYSADNPNHQFYPGALKTQSGELWFPAQRNLLIFDKDGNITDTECPLINYLCETDNKIYGAGDGLFFYKDQKLIRHYKDNEGLDMKTLGFLEVIAVDTTDLMWLGSHLGLATWDGQQFKNFILGKEVPSGIVSIKKDHRNNLWFGTHNGISFYDYSTRLPRPVEAQAFNKSIKFIEFIDSSYVLLGGSGELYLLDLPAFYKGEFDLYTLTAEDGYSREECLQNASYKDSNGQIWIGTTDGIVKLNPEKLKLYKEPTEPHFSYVSFHQASTEKEILHRIPFGQNDFSFSATSSDRNIEIKYFTINHHKAKSITYRHRLKGYEDNWSLPRSPRFVSYSNLPVGDYEFELQTCLGERCTKTKSLHFDIQPSIWHEYALVRGGVALLLGFLFYTLYRQRQQNRLAKRQSEKLEKEKTEMELKQLKMRKNLAMHKVNPHFTFNVLNAISDLIMRQEKEAALQYTAKFGNLFRPLLANEGKLFRSLREEIQFVEDYLKLEQLRFPEKFEYEIQIDDTVNQAVNVPIMVIQSFVNNAIKHGMEPLDSDGLVQIEASQAEDIITVVISDNGIGRKESEKQSGKYNTGEGIKIAEEIIQYLNEFSPKKSSIQIEELNPYNKEYPGTKVILKLYAKYEEKI